MEHNKALGQISSLIKLLTDRDEFVRSSVRDQLVELGEDALPFLEIATRGDDDALRIQANIAIQNILPQKLAEKFRQLAQKGLGQDIDLETGMMLIMEFGYPDSSPEECSQKLDDLAQKFADTLKPEAKPPEIVAAFTHFLFQENGFKGNKDNYQNPDNSFINKVLDNKTGLPITLSAICVLLAKRLNLPIVGVGMPGHYIVKYSLPIEPIYFDPFHQGRRLTKKECIQIVEQFGHSFEEHFLSQSTQRETLIRMLNNLIQVYNNSNETKKADILTEYIKILMNPSRSQQSERTP
jgi:regulator of sirC expression with transglutaminase-like and TPR domain